MKTTRETPKCEECIKHDETTRHLVRELFSEDELRVITMLMANTLQSGTNAIAQLPDSEMGKLRMRAELDFLGCSLGKVMLGFDDLKKQSLVKALGKMGIRLDIQHEVCPHEQPPAPAEEVPSGAL